MANMFTTAPLSSSNYSNTLIGWSSQLLKSGVTLGGGTSKYYTGIPASARAILTGTYGWTITDGGSQAPATFNDTTNGNWNAGATWGNVSNVEGVGYPGQYDTAIINSNTVTLSSAQSVSTTTLSATGILNLAGSNFTSPSFISSAILQLQGGETVSAPTLNASSNVEYTATTSSRDIKNWNYANSILKINGVGGTFTLPATLSFAGINITSGILDSNGYNITNSGNWANSVGAGGFNARAGTVTFNGTGSTITGATNFYRTNGTGSIVALPAATLILENNTAVTTNNGIIGINNAVISTNGNTGVVNTNNSTISINNGTTTTNASGGTITTNNNLVTTNNGTVSTNASGGTIINNNALVSTNAFGGSITHNLGSIGLNNGTADTATFTDGQYSGATGIITGDAIFNYTGFAGTTGAVIDVTGYANGVVGGLSKDSLGNTISTWVFNTTNNLGHVTGDAMFGGTTNNTGIVYGKATFNDTSINSGTIMHNVDIYSPTPRPLGGIIYGLKTYHGYTGMYFNDKNTNDGNWNNKLNWWTDSAFTIPAGDSAGAGDEVHVYSTIATTTSNAYASSITLEGGAKNHIAINISGDATFNATSTNAIDGSINASSTTFIGNLTDNLGTVTGTLIRKFTDAVTTNRNFITEGGRSNWIVIAQGVIVNISNAIYSTATNIFKALNGGLFNTGGGTAVTPVVASSLPTLNQIVTKWIPVVNWGSATSSGVGSCKYSYDNWTTSNTSDCSLNGTDIKRPTAGAQVLSLRGTDNLGNITEQNIPFTYNNAVPVYTLCGSDLLDEVTRPYYYLSSNIVGNCTATASTTLRGDDGQGNSYTISGNLTGSSSNIVLQNMNISGVVSNFASINVGSSTLSGGVDVKGTLTSDSISTIGNTTVEASAIVYSGNFVGDVTNNGTIVVGGITPTSAVTKILGTFVNNGTIIGDFVFNTNSANHGTVNGNGYFIGGATNTGRINGNADVYYEYNSLLAGTVSGHTSYHSYPNVIAFNDVSGDGSWSNPSNWFTDTTLATPLGRVPSSNEDVVLFATTTLSSDVTNNIYVATNDITLNGGSHTLSGNISGNGAYGGHDAYNFNLGNITVTGTTTAVGGDGVPGISDGGNGGTINIDTASTGGVVVNGGDPLHHNGGNAGTSTVTNSIAIVDGTRILAVGGASVGCGFGGNGGNITLIDSSGYILETATGTDAVSLCEGTPPPAPTTRTGGVVKQVGIYVSPATKAANAAAAAAAIAANNRKAPSSGGSVDQAFFATLTNTNVGKLNLTNLPNINLSGIENNLGVSKFVNPLTGIIKLSPLPLSGFTVIAKMDFASKFNNFLNSSLPKSLADLSNSVPAIKRAMAVSGIVNGYDLYTMKESPINTPTLSDLVKDKTKQPESLIFASQNVTQVSTKLMIDKKGSVYQIITVEPNAVIDVDVKNTGKTTPKTTFNGLDIKTGKDKQNIIKLSVVAPKEIGTYTLKVEQLTLQVKVISPTAATVGKGTGATNNSGVTTGVVSSNTQPKKLSPIQRLWSWFVK